MTSPHYELRKRLMVAQIASCNCQTKTHETRYHKDECRYRVLADALAALEAVDDTAAAGAAPDGYVMVPVEPTEEMVIAANEVEYCEDGITIGQLRAAIAAAPKAAPSQPTINPMCERKTDHIMERDGYVKTGYVLRKPGADREVCVSDGGAVSWFTLDQWNWLMFNRDHVEFAWPKPIGAQGSFGSSHMVLTGKAEQEQDRNRAARVMLDNVAMRRPTAADLTDSWTAVYNIIHGIMYVNATGTPADYTRAVMAALASRPTAVIGLGRMTQHGDGYVTLQFADDTAASDFMRDFEPTVDVRSMPCQATPPLPPQDAGKADHAVLLEALACIEYYEGKELADRVSAVLAKHGARIGAYTPPVVVDPASVFAANLYFSWVRQGTGFGELSLTRHEDGRVTCMNECMGRAFVRSALHALADTLADVAELQEL